MIIIDPIELEKKDTATVGNAALVDDAPPPYDGVRAARPAPPPVHPHRSAAAPAPEPVRTSSAVFQPTNKQLVNDLSIFSKHDAISGTYLVDPLLPPVSVKGSNGNRQKISECGRRLDRKHARNARRAFGAVPNSDSGPGCEGKHRKQRQSEINAAFRTRHGNIKLELAVVDSSAQSAGTGKDKEKKAHGRVMVSSRHGRLDLNLVEVQPTRSVDLDVSTRSGNITVFLPASFAGPIAFRRQGGSSGIQLLPALAARARITRGTDREMLVVISPDVAPDAVPLPAHEGDDCCVIGTRHGKITVGINGVDQLPAGSMGRGLFPHLEALIESGAKHLGTIVEARAKGFESWVEANAKALETALTARA
ncbi:hypothetical protein IEO21_02887 [Rhodonia placenta]|uniref:DUF7330 domain-containing protein n=1 Tax=Rhodonia placenta TaxID=104341 RepID=A0A8H7P6S3_9APHY|nr:hypothetical protein IEO21_02887 [Postia placenta]